MLLEVKRKPQRLFLTLTFGCSFVRLAVSGQSTWKSVVFNSCNCFNKKSTLARPRTCVCVCVCVFTDVLDGQPMFTLNSTVRTHVSSIRSLSVQHQKSLLFSAGGRGQLCAYRVPVSDGRSLTSKEKVDLKLLASYPHGQFGLRKLRLKQTNIRYMSVTSFCAQQLEPSLPDCLLIVIAVSSDGYIR
jgi:hypothetical protein